MPAYKLVTNTDFDLIHHVFNGKQHTLGLY